MQIFRKDMKAVAKWEWRGLLPNGAWYLLNSLHAIHSTLLYITLPLLYLTLLDSTILCLLPCTIALLHSTSLYLILHHPTMALLHSTWLYLILPWLYFTILYSTFHGFTSVYFFYHVSTSLYLSLQYCIMALLHSS